MAFGDSFGAASVNTYTTMELPAGSIRPVVVVKDMIQGTSDMFTGGNITVCAGKCNVAQTAGCGTHGPRRGRRRVCCGAPRVVLLQEGGYVHIW